MESEHDQTVHQQVTASVATPVSDSSVSEREMELCTNARYLLLWLMYGFHITIGV